MKCQYMNTPLQVRVYKTTIKAQHDYRQDLIEPQKQGRVSASLIGCDVRCLLMNCEVTESCIM